MKICAWCGSNLSSDELEDVHRIISHGICRDCVIIASANSVSLDDFLSNIPVPLLVVNDEVRVENANDLAGEALNKSLDEIRGFLGGDVIECIYAQFEEGCGQALHCSGCAIRNSVMETYNTGEGVKSKQALQILFHQNKKTKMRLTFSTEKLDGKVLLQLEGMEPM